MFKNLLLVGLLAGVLSGSLLTVLQALIVIPLIHQAEQYENQLPVSMGEEGKHGHDDQAEDWKPHEGWERLGFTWLANLSIASGFGLMLAGMMSLHRTKTWIQALLFGVAGYYAFFLAPAFLLPPELPGADSPDLESRQAIWIVTVVVSLLAIGLLGFATNPWLRLLGLAGLALPFMLFSQAPAHYPAAVPQDLIHQFSWMTGVINMINWVALGLLVFWLLSGINAKVVKSVWPLSIL
jgi:cobalt transporter subunit CbtA